LKKMRVKFIWQFTLGNLRFEMAQRQ